ncbi:MAG TPA: helix-turn-helix domain-containing protein [Nocardioides sp.]|nr:helix-turn-helix domain-containing protein [Nocardioides sp.]
MTDQTDQTDLTDTAERPVAGRQVEVRRNVGLAAGVGGFAALMTVAFAARAFTGGTALDWLAFGVLALVTGIHLASLSDSRAPLLVADELGVRVRQGAHWRGIAWQEIDCLEHLPRHGLRDGHLLVDGYDDQQLVVPLTLATHVVGAPADSLSDVLADLADGRADVVEVVPGGVDDDAPRRTVPSLSDLYADDVDGAGGPGERRGIAARVAAGLTGRNDAPADEDLDESDDLEDLYDTEAADASDHAEPERHPEQDRRVAPPEPHTDTHGTHARHTQGAHTRDDDTEATDEIALTDVDPVDETDTGEIEAVEPGRATVLSARVELAATARAPLAAAVGPLEPVASGDHEESDHEESVTVVLDDLAVLPAAEPVIGPEIQAARDRLRLTIDQVSERTRIRPHVIEAIEVDDFGPCGGDFYARGHLRTLARILGIDATPLVAAYDEHYAHAPVDPRRVFESELATGTGGAIRSTRGGRNWSVMIAAVMGAVLVWSVARLVMGGPAPVGEEPVLNQSGGITEMRTKGTPLELRLTAAGGGATLNVRDADGKIVFEGNLAFGQSSELEVVPPIRIYSTDGSVTYAVGGGEATALGETGTEVTKTVIAAKKGS